MRRSEERLGPSSPACEITLPREQTVPFVFNSPHSGRYYPEISSPACLDKSEIRRSEDPLSTGFRASCGSARR